jgi:hypothetical protein
MTNAHAESPAPIGQCRPAMPLTRSGVLLLLAATVVAGHEFPIARAGTGDAHISIHYRVKSVRVRPTPSSGVADVDFGIVLHADGAFEDNYSVKEGQHGSSKGKLGPASQGPVYRVLDSGSFTRTLDLGTHYHKMTIRTSGKNCTAEVAFILKPGVKEYRTYSTHLKIMAYYSSLDVEYATCVIE